MSRGLATCPRVSSPAMPKAINVVAARQRIFEQRVYRALAWHGVHMAPSLQDRSLDLHRQHCETLQHNVHFPSHAADLVRGTLGDTAWRRAKRLHRAAATERHIVFPAAPRNTGIALRAEADEFLPTDTAYDELVSTDAVLEALASPTEMVNDCPPIIPLVVDAHEQSASIEQLVWMAQSVALSRVGHGHSACQTNQAWEALEHRQTLIEKVEHVHHAKLVAHVANLQEDVRTMGTLLSLASGGSMTTMDVKQEIAAAIAEVAQGTTAGQTSPASDCTPKASLTLEDIEALELIDLNTLKVNNELFQEQLRSLKDLMDVALEDRLTAVGKDITALRCEIGDCRARCDKHVSDSSELAGHDTKIAALTSRAAEMERLLDGVRVSLKDALSSMAHDTSEAVRDGMQKALAVANDTSEKHARFLLTHMENRFQSLASDVEKLERTCGANALETEPLQESERPEPAWAD